jgi:hypothetical protein
MKQFFIKLSAKNIMVLLVALFVLLFFFGAANAALYDDFTGTGIDTTKWTVNGNGFTQAGDGYLRYGGTTSSNAKLTSTALYTSGTFTMPFADYLSNNNAPAGEGLGSVVALGLGSRDSEAWVRIERGQVLGTSIGQYIEVNWAFQSDWSNIYVNYVQSDIASGDLRLQYDGTNVAFFYRTLETDPWTQMVKTGAGGQPVLDTNNQTQPLIITPHWGDAVPMFIQAIPGGDSSNNYNLSFKVDNVSVSVPEPSAVLLFAPTLAGIAILRRKFQK